MRKVYLVMGSSGYWEDVCEWIEDAYFNLGKAEHVKDNLNKQLADAFEWMDSEEYDEMRYDTDYCEVTACKECKHNTYCGFEYDQHEFIIKEVDVNE